MADMAKRICLFGRLAWALQAAVLVLSYAIHASRFKAFGFKSIIRFPWRIQGARRISIGRSVVIGDRSWLTAFKTDECEPDLTIGDGCSIGDGAHIAATRKVHIENDVLTASHVYISDNLHCYEDPYTPIMRQPVRFKREVVIGSGSWIGEHACVIGARVGRNCVIGANSVVTRDIPDYCVAVGAPAQVIRRYDKDSGQWVRVRPDPGEADNERTSSPISHCASRS